MRRGLRLLPGCRPPLLSLAEGFGGRRLVGGCTPGPQGALRSASMQWRGACTPHVSPSWGDSGVVPKVVPRPHRIRGALQIPRQTPV